ncbi:MAG: BrnA antitoxin family protein [Alphaproteobacteria bacterium]|nr:BrnA antitoxin family protein [Alphaproteobacteria bacterium]MCB9930226.1 BrnA antitoxin family protein [Alphaproteobacteria bacterium]
MKDRGELRTKNPRIEDDLLPDEFWEAADAVSRAEKKSVHLKLDAEVFAFFKAGGKGHLTRMQNVLTAYVRAHQTRASQARDT